MKYKIKMPTKMIIRIEQFASVVNMSVNDLVIKIINEYIGHAPLIQFTPKGETAQIGKVKNNATQL